MFRIARITAFGIAVATTAGALAGSATLSFSAPTNPIPAPVTVEVNPGPDVTVMIPPGVTAQAKRDMISAALVAAGYAVTNHVVPPTSLTIEGLPPLTQVRFLSGMTGEARDTVRSADAESGLVAFTGHFAPPWAAGQPAIFTAGIVTDVGELTAQISAQELNFQTDGPIICQALFQRLAPRAPQYGAQINYAGDRLEVYFDPAYTVTQGGIIFGTNSQSQGASGGIMIAPPQPPPCPTDLNGDGVTNLTDLSMLLAAYGTHAGDPAYNPDADLNHDGEVGLTDLSMVLAQFGEPCPD